MNYSDDVTMHHPAGLFAAFFKEALARNGIKVTGQTRTINWLDRRGRPSIPASSSSWARWNPCRCESMRWCKTVAESLH